MKKTIATGAAVLLLAACGSAQSSKKEIPATVKTAFEQQYPAVKEAEWEQEGANYEAEFDLNDTETSVVFDAAGNRLETETEIEVSQLPAAAVAYVQANYIGQKIKEAAKITKADGSVNYEAEVNRKDLIFDANGTFLNVTK